MYVVCCYIVCVHSETVKVKKSTEEGETTKGKKLAGETTPKSAEKTTSGGSSSKKKSSETDLSEKRKRVIQMVKEEVDILLFVYCFKTKRIGLNFQ